MFKVVGWLWSSDNPKKAANIPYGQKAQAAKTILDITRKMAAGAKAYVDGQTAMDPQVKKVAQQLIDGAKEYIDNAGDLFEMLSLVIPPTKPILNKMGDKYSYIITEDNNHPFQVTPYIAEISAKIVKDASTEKGKAQALFDWFVNSIKYGDSKRYLHHKGYRTAAEVFNDQEGVCGEMAVLFVVMARSVGLSSNYVSVFIDNKGDKVNHACAVVNINYKNIFIDPAYYTFDINHHFVKILTDKEAVPHFKQMRGA